MMPLHSWLPRAHPAAPSHASALMSGVMVKIGIFGILKVAMDLLAQTGLPLWWGILVMAIGAISALLGVLYALAEQDIKRLLAWSTVENVGIILLAVGVGVLVWKRSLASRVLLGACGQWCGYAFGFPDRHPRLGRVRFSGCPLGAVGRPVCRVRIVSWVRGGLRTG